VTGLHVVVGLGVTGRAVTAALLQRGVPVAAVDDAPGDDAERFAETAGIALHVAPDAKRLEGLLGGAAAVLPSPGIPDRHPAFACAATAGVSVLSEFDLAARWDDRPVLAVTGTNGKTTVTTLVTEMLVASGIPAALAGNTDVPLVAAIDDPAARVFVVEASSFRLRDSRRFAPAVATWLNVAPDHLDAHASYESYVAAKARIWDDQSAGQVAIGNLDDPVVAGHLRRAPGHQVTFALSGAADWRLDQGRLLGPGGEALASVAELPRSLPHDVANALAAGATALAGGATVDGARRALLAHRGLPHRVTLVGEAGGVTWFDDSKATAPHATLAALRGFDSVVLIAGGRNKGLDLAELATESSRIRAVVAIGDAAPEVEAAFDGIRQVRVAGSMDEAVQAAASLARPGDSVLLSPGCASFDWYSSYGERGDDFARAVAELLGAPLANGHLA
jgi:UDP-N-acetylmuramoylalanine--D-glutamate ligase